MKKQTTSPCKNWKKAEYYVSESSCEEDDDSDGGYFEDHDFEQDSE